MMIRIVSERKMTDKSQFKSWKEVLEASGVPAEVLCDLERNGSAEWTTIRQGDELKRVVTITPDEDVQ